MDFVEIRELIGTSAVSDYPKYADKRWVKIQDSNYGNYDDPIKYNCRTVRDKLVSYHDGFILVKCKIKSSTATALTAAADIALRNGSNSLVQKALVNFENKEIDNSLHNYLTTTMLNMLEYSDDYARSVAEKYGFAKDSAADVISSGHTKVKLFRDAFKTADDSFPLTTAIPLTYLSTFFRRLNFPIINHTLEIEWNSRTVNSLLRKNDVEASKVTIVSTELYC